MEGAGGKGGERWDSGRAAFRLGDPINVTIARVGTIDSHIRRKGSRKCGFVRFAVDPFGVSSILFEVAAKAAEIIRFAWHRL